MRIKCDFTQTNDWNYEKNGYSEVVSYCQFRGDDGYCTLKEISLKRGDEGYAMFESVCQEKKVK